MDLLSSWATISTAGPGGDAENAEAFKVDRGGEEREVGGGLGPATEWGSSSAVTATHQVRDLACHLGRLHGWSAIHSGSACRSPCLGDPTLVASDLMLCPPAAVVHCSSNGQSPQTGPKWATPDPSLPRRIAILCPAGVTMSVSRSISKTSLAECPG